MIITPQQLWKDYDKFSLPFGETVISDSPYKDGYFKRLFYFNGETAEGGVIRVFACLYYDPDMSFDNKTVLVMDEPKKSVLDFNADELIKLGLNCMVVDYGGQNNSHARFTIYPSALRFCEFNLSGGENLKTIPSDPKKSARYYYSVIALRSIAYLKSNGFESVIMLGFGDGSPQVFMAGYFENNIIAGAAFFNYSSPLPQGDVKPENNDAFLSFLACLDPSGYAPHVKVPMYIQAASNEENNGAVVLSNIFSLLEQSGSAFYIAERTYKTVTYKSQTNLRIFLSSAKNALSIPPSPSLSFTLSGKTLYLNASVFLQGEILSLNIFTARSAKFSQYRNWQEQFCERVGGGEYLCKLPVYSKSDNILCYCSATYCSGLTICSTVLSINPASLDVELSPFTKKRLIYESDLGLGDFTAFVSKPEKSGLNVFDSNNSDSNSLLNQSAALITAVGPYDISGVLSLTGRLATFKLSDPRFSGEDGDTLQLNIYSKIEQVLTFSVILSKTGVRYTAERKISPNDEWQKIFLAPSSLRSSDGALPSFSGAALLEISGEKDSFILSSILFV